MTRSKLFLGATSCLLAIAGVAAAKAHSFNAISGRYFSKEDGLGKCETTIFSNLPATAHSAGIANLPYRSNLGVGTNPLYTFYTTTQTCKVVLYTKAN